MITIKGYVVVVRSQGRRIYIFGRNEKLFEISPFEFAPFATVSEAAWKLPILGRHHRDPRIAELEIKCAENSAEIELIANKEDSLVVISRSENRRYWSIHGGRGGQYLLSQETYKRSDAAVRRLDSLKQYGQAFLARWKMRTVFDPALDTAAAS